MKIRSSFVSNSSSTSYTIILRPEKNEMCEHCGRKDLDLMEEIQNLTDNGYSESYIQYKSKENILGDIQANIELEKKRLKKFEGYEDNDIHPDDKRAMRTITIGEQKEYTYATLKEYRDRRDKIKAIDGELVGIEVGYSDTAVQYAFDQGVESGVIEIVEDWG